MYTALSFGTSCHLPPYLQNSELWTQSIMADISHRILKLLHLTDHPDDQLPLLHGRPLKHNSVYPIHMKDQYCIKRRRFQITVVYMKLSLIHILSDHHLCTQVNIPTLFHLLSQLWPRQYHAQSDTVSGHWSMLWLDLARLYCAHHGRS